jgi:hypothetical protein
MIGHMTAERAEGITVCCQLGDKDVQKKEV